MAEDSEDSEFDEVAVEKSFNYLFREGEVRCAYRSAEHLQIQLKLFKRATVPDEVRNRLQEMKDISDTNGDEADMDEVRRSVDPEIQEFRKQALAEIKHAQTQTAGIQVGQAVLNYCVPTNFERVIDSHSNSKTGIDNYPFNFGVRIRSTTNPLRVYFVCLANDDCRTKHTQLQINQSAFNSKGNSRLTPKQFPSDEEVVVHHLQDQHWGQLVQLKYV